LLRPVIIAMSRRQTTAMSQVRPGLQGGDFAELVGRYLCADHEHLDPWDQTR